MTRAAVLLSFAIAVFSLTACGGFSDADIENCKQSIREEFSRKPGVTVVDVVMMRESSKKLTGLVKIKVPPLGELTRSCSATMGDGNRYIWTCE
jgi:hypothetical protein